MKVHGHLASAIIGPGFTIQRGHVHGELDEHGLVWIDATQTARIRNPNAPQKRLGVPVAKFSYLEEGEPSSVQLDKRAEINAMVKKANAIAEKRQERRQ